MKIIFIVRRISRNKARTSFKWIDLEMVVCTREWSMYLKETDDLYERTRWMINDSRHLRGIMEFLSDVKRTERQVSLKLEDEKKKKKRWEANAFSPFFFRQSQLKMKTDGKLLSLVLAGTRTWESNYGPIRRWSSEIVGNVTRGKPSR